MTVNKLKELNSLTNNNLSIGQKLIVSDVVDDTDIYVVKKGDSLYKIANKYNTTVNELKELNNLTSDSLSIGQILSVPLSNELYVIYKVKSGDTLYKIANMYNTTVNEIKILNDLDSNLLSVGQELKIPR